MNLAALPELLLSWVKNQGAQLLQGDKAQAAGAFKPGQQYEGKVLDHLGNGRHLVRVGGQSLDMNLPRNTQPGDSVRLTFLNAGPRPTFLLNTAPVTSAQQVSISQAAHQVNALMRIAGAPTPAAAQSGTVAGAANPVAGLTGTVPANAAGAIRGVAGLAGTVAAAPVATAGRAAAASSVALSSTAQAAASLSARGAEMAATATRPIVVNVDILRNYSAAFRLTPAPVASANTGLVGQPVDELRAALPNTMTMKPSVLAEMPSPARQMLPIRLSQTVKESGMFYESHLARWARGGMPLEAIQREPQARLAQAGAAVARLAELGGMPEEAAKLAGRQLQMLEGAPFQWQGQVWPGQWLEWLVRERAGGEADGGQGEDAPQSDWETELRLILPRLGEVRAHLDLSGAQLTLRVVANETATRDTLRAALPLLLKGLDAAGLSASVARVEAPRAE